MPRTVGNVLCLEGCGHKSPCELLDTYHHLQCFLPLSCHTNPAATGVPNPNTVLTFTATTAGTGRGEGGVQGGGGEREMVYP